MTVICWFRRVLRLDDHPALVAAAQDGAVIPLVILDPAEARAHPASAERQALSLPPLAEALERLGSRLIVRRGDPAEVLEALARQTGATVIHATTGFPFATDDGLEAAAERGGARLQLHPLADLVPRGSVLTGSGGVYKVFSPFWKAVRQVQIAPPLAVPKLTAPQDWPDSDGTDWPEARAAMVRGWDVLARHTRPGEDEAHARLEEFLEGPLPDYKADRNLPWRPRATSGLADALACGEISARRIWARVQPDYQQGAAGSEHFLSELCWREFARELMAESPDLDRTCWREEWNRFPWRGDNDDAEAWRRGRTGVPMVDAGMREMFVTGQMHNRVRMITGSYVTKHLLTDWKVGLDWFGHCLSDWDAASNAMNWQWVAGCGPDAAPYFRVFNPETQAEKFDAEAQYRRYWLDPEAEGARAFAEAAPRAWKIDLHDRPKPALSLAEGRDRALDAYQGLKS
ncbi:deoxyribodipyrimidine photo-lyase [Paracoccus liaowanqingii]|uniref:Deoxyribodipyrimidine photo-lyase n=1 Tax=Paracoccus liaowanqingii TaxID=2560053 RepID=A0A4Z1CAU7_9RHOB|nr:deoxyribodipyrimidine photo-lyase [Paracoccus liaowanqingii]TGN56077.1 deoxyribodipyrimidine photo-lyase [Paracoccus liaowanqingii]